MLAANSRSLAERSRIRRRSCRSDKANHRSAFSLTELIGVLAILAILVAVVVPVVIKRIDLAAYSAESASLNSMSAALIQYVPRSNTIPNQTGWVQAISSELALSSNQIAVTRRNYSRTFLIDTNGWLGTALATNAWSQSLGGTVVAPGGARLMLVSTIAGGVPVASGKPSAADFNAIWNTPRGAKPTGTSYAGWPNGGDLVIQRINLQPLFHRVILVNGAGGQGYFSINSSTPPATVPTGGSGINSFYLDGTVLGLYATNSLGTNLVDKEVIRSDMSRVCEYGVWRDQITVGLNPPVPTDLTSAAAQFFTQSAPPGAPAGSTPQSVMSAMMAYMHAYTTWAAMLPECFAYDGPGQSWNNQRFPPGVVLLKDLDSIETPLVP